MPDNTAHGFTARQLANLAGGVPDMPPPSAYPMSYEDHYAALAAVWAAQKSIALTKTRKRQPPAKTSARLLRILARDGWRCGLCFGIIHTYGWNELSRPSVDHIWPQSWPKRSWTHDLVNLRPAHAKCNSDRSADWDAARDIAALERNGFNVAYL